MEIEKRQLKRLNSSLCYYTGKIQNDDESSVALSLCNGLVWWD